MKARFLTAIILVMCSIKAEDQTIPLAEINPSSATVNKSECNEFSEKELNAITNQLDGLFHPPVVPTPEWNAKVSHLLDQLPYSKYNRMYNFVMGTTYKKAIDQKFQKFQQQHQKELQNIRRVDR